MANARISQVQLDQLYDIYDASAVHELADLGLEGYLKFKGAVADMTALNAITGAAVGDVYHVIDVDSEYIWVADNDPAVTGHWEEFGSKLMIDHTHNIPELSGSIQSNGSAAAQTWTQKTGTVSGEAAAQTWTQQSGSVSGEAEAQEWTQDTGTISGSAAAQKWTQGTSSVTVAGSNAASDVSVSGTVKEASGTTKYLTASATKPNITPTTDNVLGEGTVFTASGTAVGANGTAAAITALGTPTTSAAITSLNTTKIDSVNSVTEGEAASWGATVSGEILSFNWKANTPTVVNTTETTVATGSAKTTAAAITGFGTHTTKDVLTGVKVTAQPTIAVGAEDRVAAMTGAALASAPSVTLTTKDATSTGAVQYVQAVTNSNVTKTFTGEAEGQVWTQGASSVTVAGTNAASTVSGTATVTGTNTASDVSGTATVTGTNAKSTVSGSATVTGTNAASKVTGSVKVGPGTTNSVNA